MLKILIYTERIIPPRFAGITIGFLVLIRLSHKDDAGLLAHELVHVRQFWRNPLMGLWYLLNKKARLRYEAEAYREQIRHYPDDRSDMFAGFLAERYGLGITQSEALMAIKTER